MPFSEPPVRFIEPDATDTRAPRAGIALCLSGGGYRAMLFHLGALKRLNELAYLPKLDQVSSVSGGSITAGVLAMNWKRLRLQSGQAANFDDEVTTPVRKLAGITVDGWSIVGGLALPGSINDKVTSAYRKHVFGQRTLQDIPADDEGPRFVFNATNVQSGVLMRFSRPYVADYRVGSLRNPTIELAVAVAASSAFPPFLSPAHLEFAERDWVEETGNDLHRVPYTTDVILTDGGVYDNLGLEPVKKRCGTVFVSDGGGTFQIKAKPRRDWVLGTKRLLEVLDVEVRRLRRREIVGALKGGFRKGAFWAINTDPAVFERPASTLPCTYDQTKALSLVSTRLKKLPDRQRNRIANWGYTATDASLRDNYDQNLAVPSRFPYNDGIG